MDIVTTRLPQPTPLNRERDFVTWPPFNPGLWLDMNPAFVRLSDNDAWVIFTRYSVPPQPGIGSLWAVRVDARRLPIGEPQVLIEYGIDPRVIQVGERVLVFYTFIERDSGGIINGSFVALAEFVVAGDQWISVDRFQLPKHPIEKDLPADAQQNWEKNWVPFAIGSSDVGLIYSHDPWDVIILNVDPGQPRHFRKLHSAPPIQWDFGTIRGAHRRYPMTRSIW